MGKDNPQHGPRIDRYTGNGVTTISPLNGLKLNGKLFFFFPFSPLYVALWAPTCNWLSGAHFGWTTRFHQKKSHGFPMEKTVKNYSVSLGKGLKKWCLKPFSLNVAILTNSLHLNNPGTANLYNTYG